MNSLSAKGDIDSVRQNHCETLSPDNWVVEPSTIFEEEKNYLEEKKMQMRIHSSRLPRQSLTTFTLSGGRHYKKGLC